MQEEDTPVDSGGEMNEDSDLDIDSCIADIEMSDDETTADDQLPAADGGVEEVED